MREEIFLECTECGERYYRTSKNVNERGTLELKKFCRRCGEHTVHRER
jgi:large subunit ribosomal protein L33